MRSLWIVGGVAVENVAFAGRIGGGFQLIGAGVAAEAIGLGRGSIDRGRNSGDVINGDVHLDRLVDDRLRDRAGVSGQNDVHVAPLIDHAAS